MRFEPRTKPVSTLGIDAAVYVIVLESPRARQIVHSTESVQHCYGAAVTALAQAEPGQFDMLHLFVKEMGSHNVRATRRVLPLGPGAFTELTQSAPVSPFTLSTTSLAPWAVQPTHASSSPEG